MSCECQCGQGGGSDIENINCSGFIWCLSRDVLWTSVFENYWGNGFDCCSREKFLWNAFVEPHLLVQAKVVGHLLKDLFWPSFIFCDLLWSLDTPLVVQAKVVGRLLKERSSLTSQKFSLASCLMCACKRGHVKVSSSSFHLVSPVSSRWSWSCWGDQVHFISTTTTFTSINQTPCEP